MPKVIAQSALLVVPLLACSAGTTDGLTGLSGAYSAGPSEGSDTGGSEGSEEDSADSAMTTGASAEGTSGGADGGVGNPLCCQVGSQAGCENDTTEACVCTSLPACCQNVWSQDCVDLAVACGDPFCSGDDESTSDGTTGDTSDTGVDLECDPDFEFSPQNPAAGVAFSATFSDPVGLTWVGMHAEGPGGAMVEGGNLEITGSGPFHWSYDFAGLAAGVWTFTFTHRQSENGGDIVAGACLKQFQ